MASIADILTAAQNLVTAVNGVAKTMLDIQGIKSVCNISTNTVISSNAGRLATVSILVGGSGTGMIYDGTSLLDTTRPLFDIPTTPGIVFVNLPVSYGVVVMPGTGQVVTVSYS